MNMENPPYQYKKEVKYTNNNEYRNCLRVLFTMNETEYANKVNELTEHLGEEFDAETRDEIEFDEKATSNAMDYIYDKTINNLLFENIYTFAAAKMMSVDVDIGLAVCFSYDYLEKFHSCVSQYLVNPEGFTEDCECYKSLIKQIS